MTDPRVRLLARLLKPQHETLDPCACYSCSGRYADDYAARVIRTCEAAGLKVEIR